MDSKDSTSLSGEDVKKLSPTLNKVDKPYQMKPKNEYY